MQHVRLMWMKRVAVLVAMGFACVPAVGYAEADSSMRVERTSAFDVVLTIGPAQTMSLHSEDMGMSHDMSMGGHEMMPPQEADQGMAVNHWLDVEVTEAGSGAVVNDVTPTIRIVDKSTGEARDVPNVMAVSAADLHFGQNIFLPDGTYHIRVLLGPADTAVFRDVIVASSPQMAQPAMNGAMGGGHDMNMNDTPGTHP